MFTGKSLMSALLTNGFWYKLIVNLSSSILFFGGKFTHLFSDGRVYYFCIDLVGGKELLSSRGGGGGWKPPFHGLRGIPPGSPGSLV